jgi:DNA-binding NarL/FixJ family response regulator
VAFTAEDDPEVQRAAFEAGASGFVWKPRAGRDLLTTIRDVYVSNA